MTPASTSAFYRRIGDPMTLRRLPSTDVACYGKISEMERPSETDQTGQRSYACRIAAAELTAASWPVPPRNGDRVIAGGVTYSVQSAMPAKAAGQTVAWALIVRG